MQKQSHKYKKPNQTQVHTEIPTLSEQQLQGVVGGHIDPGAYLPTSVPTSVDQLAVLRSLGIVVELLP